MGLTQCRFPFPFRSLSFRERKGSRRRLPENAEFPSHTKALSSEKGRKKERRRRKSQKRPKNWGGIFYSAPSPPPPHPSPFPEIQRNIPPSPLFPFLFPPSLALTLGRAENKMNCGQFRRKKGPPFRIPIKVRLTLLFTCGEAARSLNCESCCCRCGGTSLSRSTFPIVAPSSNSCFSSGWDPLLPDKISLRGGICRSLIRFLFGVGSLTYELKEGMQIYNSIPVGLFVFFPFFYYFVSAAGHWTKSLLVSFSKRPFPGGSLIGPQDGEAGGVQAEGTLRADASHIHLRH